MKCTRFDSSVRRVIVAAIAVVVLAYAPAADAATLKLYWPLNGNANDASGNNNDGTEAGDVTYEAGVAGQGAKILNTGGSSIIDPDAAGLPVLAADSFSLSFWIKRLGPNPAVSTLGGFGDPDSLPMFPTDVRTTREIWTIFDETHFVKFNASGGTETPNGDLNLGTINQLDRWEMWAATYDGPTKTISVYQHFQGGGGGLVPSLNTSNPNPASPFTVLDAVPDPGVSTLVRAGLSQGGAPDAVFDDFRIYEGVLTPSEIQALANIPEPASVALFAVGLLGLAALRQRCVA